MYYKFILNSEMLKAFVPRSKMEKKKKRFVVIPSSQYILDVLVNAKKKK